MLKKRKFVKSFLWVPSLYFIEGIPNVVVVTVSLIMYNRLGLSNSEATFYTAWLYLPWLIKPLWSPVVDLFKTKRWWIVLMQLLLGAAMAGIAFTLPVDNFVQYTLALFFLIAFSSATHDIAADGFYMLGLSERNQSLYVGIRSTFYRLAMILGQGALVVFAGYLEEYLGNVVFAWQLTFVILAILLVVFALYHWLILPHPDADVAVGKGEKTSLRVIGRQFLDTFLSFLKKDGIGYALAFLLCFRLGEAQLTKMASLFMLDERVNGGLELSTKQVGIVYGTVGTIALTLGGVIGGIVASVKGLRYWIYIMAVAINLPNVVYVFMATVQPDSFLLINTCVAIEQFGYGFGFTAYMLYMIFISEGKSKTAHFALCTGIMAAGLMLPGMWSGWLQSVIGYKSFFIWVLFCAVPIFFIIPSLTINRDFGKKT